MSLTDLPAEEGVTLSDASVKSLPKAERDAVRCRLVEDALYRRARGYQVKLKKSFKVKVVEYDPDTGKKVAEREDLKDGFEEIHVPADVRVCAYYLNNRDPSRWREHPKEEPDGEGLNGIVAYPDLEAPGEDGSLGDE